ncbi:hypothetical protein RHSIM_Rhsim07G0254600 [Rhododendron simsii]|uniref:DUF241 domain protein n=1 Tax=Rhododendron simsii TaxID=118357 RepID=A0A834GKS1_RHOSS|nr:hypothetical protein RHSIM_Rhsim07G0254600 [Rhododendron simsii]
MTTKMVSKFRRSLSFPNHSHSKDSKHFSNTTSHLRSASLPSTSHPLISQLKDHLNRLKSWAAAGSMPDTRTSAWLCDGLTRLKTVHNYFDDILRLPQTKNSLRRHTDWTEKLLEDFLRFVDAYGIFQTLIFALKREHSAAQVSVRRKVESKIEMYAKAMRKMDKEMGDLVSAIRCMRNSSNNFICNVDAELVEVILDVKEVTVLVSTALFCGISLSLVSKKPSWIGSRFAKKGRVEEGIQEFKKVGTEISLWGFRKKGDEEYLRMVLKRMHELEDCIVKIEMGSERVFRSLINTRVSLLNVLTN